MGGVVSGGKGLTGREQGMGGWRSESKRIRNEKAVVRGPVNEE